MKNRFIIFVILISQQVVEAQYTKDSVLFYSNDIVPNLQSSYLLKTDQPHFKFSDWAVPSAMILYGALTTRLDAFADLNENFKKTIWIQYPHQNVTIDNYLQWTPALAVYGLNFAGIHGQNNFLDRTMIYIISNVIMNTTVSSMKEITHQQRPNGADYLSFPSGHTAEAFASAEFLMQEYKNVSVWYGIGGYTVATSVAFLRMYNNKHWLSDVIAGAGFGIISTRLAYVLYPKIKKIFSHTPVPNSALLPYYQNKSFGVAFVHEFK